MGFSVRSGLSLVCLSSKACLEPAFLRRLRFRFGRGSYLATPKPFAMGAASGAEPSYGSNLARRSKLILGLSAAVLGLFLVARIVVEDILPRFGISGGSSTLRWW